MNTVATRGLSNGSFGVSDIDTMLDKYSEVPDYPSAANYGRRIDRRLPELRKLKYHVMPFNSFHFCNTAFR